MDRGAWRTIYSMGCKESCIYLHNWATQAYRHTAPGTNATSDPPRWVSGSSLSRGKWSTQLGTGYAWVLSGVVIQCGHQGAPRIRTISTFFFLLYYKSVFSLSTSLHLLVFILFLSLSQTMETSTCVLPASLLAECILQNPLLSTQSALWRSGSVRSWS